MGPGCHVFAALFYDLGLVNVCFDYSMAEGKAPCPTALCGLLWVAVSLPFVCFKPGQPFFLM